MRKVLLQLDTDPHPSVFDRIVAIDADIDEVLSYGNIDCDTAPPLVHGAMFTRGGNDLRHTAIFIGGSDVPAGERLLDTVRETFFPGVSVSVMMDSNGSNTTASAAVLLAGRHLPLQDAEALVLGGTGPVGQRVAQLLASAGAHVRLASRSPELAGRTCERIARLVPEARLTPVGVGDAEGLGKALAGVSLVVSTAAAGIRMVSAERLFAVDTLRVAVDLNAVPPSGLEGVEPTDRGTERDGVVCYGAIGVGGLKMKIHKAALRALFEANDRVLDTAAIHAIGCALLGEPIE